MRKVLPVIFSFFLLFFAFSCMWTRVCLAAPGVSAKAAILIDMRSGQVLWEKNACEPLPPASLTKVLTAITAIENAALEQLVLISPAAAAVGESSINLRAGEKLTIAELLQGALLPSGNDACHAIAEGVAGSESLFVHLLNLKAMALGAYGASIHNTNGLPHERHLMTAHDLALISRYAMQNGFFAESVRARYATIGQGISTRHLKNTNKLLWLDPEVIGIKTGTTDAAGPCLLAAKNGNGMTLLSVVLNSDDRYGDSLALLNYGIKNYRPLDIIAKGEVLAVLPVTGGQAEFVAVYAANDGYCLYPVSKKGKMSMVWQLPEKLEAPVRKGQAVGRVSFVDDEGASWGYVDLLAADDVAGKQMGLLDWIKKWLKGAQ
ncbi:MAG: D-alanyl-D-alanine carboxypeptidase [Clostridiales bacterium]|nr:D-alanyl-D-alanine carboxypeptidase [Clostridiales bacterium]